MHFLFNHAFVSCVSQNAKKSKKKMEYDKKSNVDEYSEKEKDIFDKIQLKKYKKTKMCVNF